MPLNRGRGTEAVWGREGGREGGYSRQWRQDTADEGEADVGKKGLRVHTLGDSGAL